MAEHVGTIKMYAGSVLPSGWLWCDGSSYSMTGYADLFSVIADTYGSNGTTEFNVPNFCSRVPVGVGTGSGLSTYGFGQLGGTETHTLLESEIPSHAHAANVSTGNSAHQTASTGDAIASPGIWSGRTFTHSNGFDPSTPNVTLHSSTVGNTGGSGAHNNVQPYIGIGYIICAVGDLP